MRIVGTTVVITLASVMVMGLAACNRGDEGVAEHAGKQIDKAVQGARDATAEAAKKAADAGQAVHDAAKDAAALTKDAAGNAVEAAKAAARQAVSATPAP